MGTALYIEHHPLKAAGRATALGDLLRRLRAREGVSQEAMAGRIGMHPSFYGSLERGGNPGPGLMTFARLARGYRVSIAPLATSYSSREYVELPPVDPDADTRASDAGPISRGSERAAALGQALTAMRERAGLTQTGLARRSGVQRTYVVAIESGAKVNTGIATIARLVHGTVPAGTDLSVVISLLAQVFMGEVSVDAFGERIADFLESPPGLVSPTGTGSANDSRRQGGGGAPRW
jgi:transcriptional regulator with XRE-family HTH domain